MVIILFQGLCGKLRNSFFLSATQIIDNNNLLTDFTFLNLRCRCHSQFLAFDTQMLLGNKRYTISPEEYIFATLSIYLDIIYLFSFLLQIMGGGRD